MIAVLRLAHRFAFTNCPQAESIVLSAHADKLLPIFGDLFLDEPVPVDGYVTLDASKPGFGVTLNPAVRANFERPCARAPRPFAEIEAAKDARTPDQAEWLRRAETTIPIGQEAT